MKNKDLIIVIAIILLSIIIFLGITTRREQGASIIEEETAQSEEWQTYRNKELGFEFQYPQQWGNIVIENGNRNIPTVDSPHKSGAPIDSFLRYDTFSYDKRITFSNSPLEGGFYILSLTPKPKNRIWGREEGSIDVFQDKQNLQNIIPGEEILLGRLLTEAFINRNGIKVLYYPEFHATQQFYKFYGDTLGVEGGMEYTIYAYTPESEEAKKYEDRDGVYSGITSWIEEGETSENIRDTFNVFHEIVDTFKFLN